MSIHPLIQSRPRFTPWRTPRLRRRGPICQNCCSISVRVEPIRSYEESSLSIRTPDVLARIERGDQTWESMVPPAVAEIVKAKHFFRPQFAPQRDVPSAESRLSTAPAQ